MMNTMVKGDGSDWLTHPIDDKSDGIDNLAHPIDDKLGEGSAMIGGETGGAMLAGGGDMMTDTGTECAAPDGHTLVMAGPDGQEIGVESELMPEMAMAGGAEA